MIGARFYVVELAGYTIQPGVTPGGNARVMLTASVLDRAYCHREVARFTEPRGFIAGEPGKKAGRVTWAQDQAAAAAARLNAEHEAA